MPPSTETDALLLGYALEGARLSGGTSVYQVSIPSTAEKTADGPAVEPEKIHINFVRPPHSCQDHD